MNTPNHYLINVRYFYHWQFFSRRCWANAAVCELHLWRVKDPIRA
jgi:hypothetical protein